jgi:hypothetical protein
MKEHDHSDLRSTAYDAHYRLLEHYSSLILRARISIVTVTLVVIAYAFGVVPESATTSTPLFGIDSRAPVALMGALFLAFLFLMEVSYLMRLYQVILSGRALEGQESLPSYFTKFIPGQSWPIHTVYTIAVMVLIAIFLQLTWDPDYSFWRMILIVVAAFLPIAGVILSYARLKSFAGNST